MTLSFFYPSSLYSYKNHHLLFDLSTIHLLESLDITILLTLENLSYLPISSSLQYLGEIPYSDVQKIYSFSNAVLFLSSYESYGLPLLEAADHLLPILCPYKSYAFSLLGKSPYYFSLSQSLPRTLYSLHIELRRLSHDLRSGHPITPATLSSALLPFSFLSSLIP